MTQAQDRGVVVERIGQRIDPEHQVLGPHPIDHGRPIGTTGASAEALHRLGH